MKKRKTFLNRMGKRAAALALSAFLALGGVSPAYAVDGYIDGTADGWYFIRDAYNERLKPVTEAQCQAILTNLLAMQEELNGAGIYFVVFIAPDKEEIYGNLLPERYRPEDPDPIGQLVDYLHVNASGLPVIYPKETLKAAREAGVFDGIPLYYSNDAHWNIPGGYVAAQDLIRVIGEHFGHGEGTIPHTFSLTSRVKYNTTWTDYYTYTEPPQSVLTKRLISPENHDPVFAYYTGTHPQRWPEKVYFAGDSFRLNVAPALSERFSSLVSMNRYYLDFDDVAAEDPDVFVLSLVGRFVRDEFTSISGFNTAALPLTGLVTRDGPAGWEWDNNGLWWRNADGTYPLNTWLWLDGDGDGVYERYYFDENGYCVRGTSTPDGCQVNEDGAWMVDGTVQTRTSPE